MLSGASRTRSDYEARVRRSQTSRDTISSLSLELTANQPKLSLPILDAHQEVVMPQSFSS